MAKKSARKTKKVEARAFGVILEDMDGKIDQVLEGHAALGKELSDFRHEMHGQVELIDFKISTLVENDKDFRNQFETIMKYLSHIDDEIQDLKKRLVSKADLDRLVALEQRVVQIELAIKKHHGANRN